MLALLVGEFALAWHSEVQANPVMATAGPLLEGKEQRFGVMNSVLFAVATTGTSCGAVNSMHDSFTPLAGMVPLWNLMLGCIVFGGVGAGLYGMLVFIVIAIFIAGLMVGVVTALTIQFQPDAANAVMYVFMAVILLLRPRGLLGERWERFE